MRRRKRTQLPHSSQSRERSGLVDMPLRTQCRLPRAMVQNGLRRSERTWMKLGCRSCPAYTAAGARSTHRSTLTWSRSPLLPRRTSILSHRFDLPHRTYSSIGDLRLDACYHKATRLPSQSSICPPPSLAKGSAGECQSQQHRSRNRMDHPLFHHSIVAEYHSQISRPAFAGKSRCCSREPFCLVGTRRWEARTCADPLPSKLQCSCIR